METQFVEATITKANDGSFIAVASTNAKDRHGEVVDNNGWDLKAYKKNPVILWAHDHGEPAIGVSKKTWVEGAGNKAKLMIQPLIHDVTDKARAIKELIEMGVIKTLSVGFKPLESPDGVTYTKNELLEVSMVNVPANADAMMMAYKGLKDKGFEEKVIEELGIKQMDEPKMRKSMKGMRSAMDTMETHMSDMMGHMGMKSFEDVIDKFEDMSNRINELETMVKAQQSVNPSSKTQITRERVSMNKVIARAADKLLEAKKKNVPVDEKQLIKVIKRASEIAAAREKDKLDG